VVDALDNIAQAIHYVGRGLDRIATVMEQKE
jgi:hypothetical protein